MIYKMDIILHLIKCHDYRYHENDNVYWKNKEFVLKAIKIDVSSLRYASEELKNDENFIIEVIKNRCYSMEYTLKQLFDNVSKELLNNKKFVLKILRIDGCLLRYVPYEFQNDKEIVLEAIRDNGYNLECASYEIRNDKKIVAISLKTNGYSLEHASEKLQSNKKLILMALKELYFVDHIKFKENNKKFTDVIHFDMIRTKKSFSKILKFY